MQHRDRAPATGPATEGTITTSADTATRPSERAHWFPRVVGVIGGASFLAAGLWAMIGPESFFDALANFAPYNQHFLQDIGAFLIGLGAVLVLAAIPSRADALGIGLVGVGLGSAAHTISHILGRNLGGNPDVDIPLLALATVVLLAAGVVRLREDRSSGDV